MIYPYFGVPLAGVWQAHSLAQAKKVALLTKTNWHQFI
jgi:hypothetical protein